MNDKPGFTPRAILFDLFHTLVNLNDTPGPTTAEILGIDPADWNMMLFEKGKHHALGEVADRYESLRRIVDEVDPHMPEERIRRAADARPLRFRHALERVRPEILDSITRLRELKLKIALVSNAGLDEIEGWPDSPLAPLFDAVLFSCHEKVAKPDPRIYARATERVSVAADSCLFVGDGGSDEHTGAAKAGMSTVLILGMLREVMPDIAATRSPKTDWVVETFPELVELIERLILQ